MPKTIFTFFLLLTALVLADSQSEAKSQAETLLGMLDKGAYAEAYGHGSKLLTGAISAEDFAASLKQAGQAVGKRKSRKFAQASQHEQLNGVSGEFYVFRYSSAYANLPQAAELLTLAREDGKWKLAGYQVLKPEAVPKGM